MPQAAFGRIALVGKLGSPEIAASLRELVAFLKKRGCETFIEKETASDIGERGLDYAAIGAKADLAVVIGGDGTLLAAARNLVRHRVPAVVGKGSQGRLIEFELRLDGEFVYALRADGVIVATPTGSTAYALSAQGPILHPAVAALALVPLAPHTLSARPVSVSDRSVIEISLKHALDARAHFDGLALADMQEGDRLVLKRSADSVRFVHPPGYRYFATLREKLGWSEVPTKPG